MSDDRKKREDVRKIFKYPVQINDIIKILLPEDAEILTVQLQHGKPYMWARVFPEKPLVERRFCIFGTGWPINMEPMDYIGTFQVNDGSLVFHLFELI